MSEENLMPLPMGHILEDRYRIDTRLGQGGHGRCISCNYLRLFSPRALREHHHSPHAYRVTGT